MDNHYHLVLYMDPVATQKWTNEDVADKKKLKKYRRRLGKLSWFMARLNQPLAKQSNQEDCCTGRFWQDRYTAQVLLDEASVFSAMTYADLNPIRANIAKTLERLR